MTQQNRREEWQGRLEAFGASPSPAYLSVQHRTPAERAGRGILSLLGCLGAAAVLVFIPLLHIPLVLGSTIAGFFLAARWFREDVSLLGVRGECPRCHVVATLHPGGRAAAERKVHCPHCREQLLLTTMRHLATPV